jgi:small conductance mechanosensitive channel
MEQSIKEIQSLIASYGLQVLGAFVTLVIGIWIAKWLAKIAGRLLHKRDVDPTLIKFAVSLVKIALITFVIISAISQVGIETTSFVAVIGAAGLAVGFALQGSLSNFASGIMLIIFKPMKVGDYIEGGGASGSVEAVGIFVTTLTTPDNKVVYIPNSSLTR